MVFVEGSMEINHIYVPLWRTEMKGLHTPLLGGSSASHSLGALHVCVCVCVCVCMCVLLLTYLLAVHIANLPQDVCNVQMIAQMLMVLSSRVD
jgi:hypothetical protein